MTFCTALGVEEPAMLLLAPLRRLLLPMAMLGLLSLKARIGTCCSLYAYASYGLCIGYYPYTHDANETSL